jgi:PAS domain S-box-containing protein
MTGMWRTTAGRVLVVDDEDKLMDALVEALTSEGYAAAGFLTGEAALEALQEQEFDLLLTDLMMPRMNGIALLKAAMAIDQNLVGIIMTGQGTVPTAVEAMKSGAFDYVLKPFRLERLLPVLKRALELRQLRMENIQLRETLAIYNLSETLAFSLDSKQVVEKTAEAALQQTDADEVSIMLVGRGKDELYVAAVRGGDREHLLGQRITLQEGIAGWVARQAEPLILNGEVSDPRFAPIRPRAEIRSAMSVPMLAGGQVVGVLNVNSLQPHRQFTPGQVKALSILTGTAAAALENEALYRDLEAREKRFRALIENSSDAIALLNLEGRFIYTSASARRVLGYEPEELVGQIAFELIHPDDQEAMLTGFMKAVQKPRHVATTQLRVRHQDDSWRWIEATAQNLLNEPGVEAMVVNYRDITERRQAERQIEYQADLLAHVNDSIVASDENYILTSWNKAAETMYGWKAEEVLGRNGLEILQTEWPAASAEERRRTIAATDRWRGEATQARRDGSRIPVEVSSMVLRDPNGQIAGYVSVNHDITERTKAEEALRESEARYRLATHATNDVIWEWSSKTKQLIWTENAQLVFGYSPEEIDSETWWDERIHPDDRGRVLSKLNAFMAGEESIWLEEYRFLIRDGSYAYISDRGYIERDESGQAVRVIGAMSDITERKRAEKALRQSEEQYRSLFEDSPISLWVEDFSEVKQRLDELKKNGVQDIPAYLRQHPDFVSECANCVRILDANSAAMKLYHARSKNELLGSLSQLFHTLPLEQFENELIQMANGRLNFEREEIDHTLTGERIYVNMRWSVAPGYEDSLAKVIVSTMDITERKQAEEQLRDSEIRYRMLFESNPHPMWIYDLETLRFLAVNDAALEHYGYSKDEFLSMTIEEIRPAEDVPALMADLMEFRPALHTPTVWRHIRKDGTLINVEITSHSVQWEERPARLVLANDITDRKRAEDALREKEQLLSEAQRIGHVGSWRYDFVADTLMFSDEMYRLFDIPPQDFQHNSEGFLRSIYSPDRPMVAKWLEDIKAGRQTQQLEFLIFRKNSELCYIHCTGAVEFDRTGTPARFIGTAQDVTERKLAEIQIRQQIEHLTALRKIDQAISSSFDLNVTLDIVLSQVISQLQVDAADVLLLDPDGRAFTYAVGKGFRTQAIETARLRMADSQAVRERRAIHVENLENKPDGRLLTRLGATENFVCYFGLPLIVKGKVKGVLEVFHRAPLQPYPEWLDFLNTLAGQAAIAIEDAQLFENLERSNRELSQAYDATIEGWSRALDLRDKETEGHTQRVTEMMLNLARAFGLPEKQLLHIRWGALLHDIGKMGVPDNILLKSGELTEEEWARMRRHPQYAYDLLKPISFLAPALDIPYCHHEKWDGTGYPRGLKGEEIPLAARLFAVVDVWDALRSDRPYRKAWTAEESREYIREQAGSYFDSTVVEHFLELIKE